MPAFLIPALKHWKLAILGLLLMALAVQSVRLGHKGNQLERANINLRECRQGRIDDRKAYGDAQRKAAEFNAAEVSRIKQEQEQRNEVSERNTVDRLERLRRELRGQNSPVKGVAGSAGASPNGAAPANPDGTARVCISAPELLRAAENEERHDQLITWVEEQLKVQR